MRSKWKGSYISPQFLKRRKLSKVIYLRSSQIPLKLFDKRVLIHNGKKNMLYHKFGEFVPTKIMGSSIHFRKKNKKRTKK